MFKRIMLVLFSLTLVPLFGCGTSSGGCRAPVAYEVNAPAPVEPTDKFNVWACTFDAQGDVTLRDIRVNYQLTHDPAKAGDPVFDIFNLRKTDTLARTPFQRPNIGYPVYLSFELTITVTIVGNDKDAIGDVLECWTEEKGSPTHVVQTKITKYNYNNGKAKCITEFSN